MQFAIETTPEFDFDMLPRFAEEHGVTYSVGFDEGYTVTFRSDNRDHLEEALDQFHWLVIEDIHEELRSTNWTGGVYTG